MIGPISSPQNPKILSALNVKSSGVTGQILSGISPEAILGHCK